MYNMYAYWYAAGRGYGTLIKTGAKIPFTDSGNDVSGVQKAIKNTDCKKDVRTFAGPHALRTVISELPLGLFLPVIPECLEVCKA